MTFDDKILSVLKEYPQGTAFLAAVSGGADSAAMLVSLCHLLKNSNFNFKLAAVHVEHGLRSAKESRGDAEFVRDFCAANGIECYIKNIRRGKIADFAARKRCGIEAAARNFRHKTFFKYAALSGENTVILLAHTKDDLLETSLMRVLRGAGPAGLAAFSKDNAECAVKKICRPLLSFYKAEVIEYLKTKNIGWREDSTNADEKFLRNKIRRRLTPLLNEYFPSWKTNVAALAETQSLVAGFLVREAALRIKWEEEDLNANRAKQRGQVKKVFSADLNNFFSQPQIIREEALFLGINKLFSKQDNTPKKSIKRSVIRRFCSQEINSADLGSLRIRRENNKVLIFRESTEFFECGISRLIGIKTHYTHE